MDFKLSVIIPTFNRLKFLERALASVINQSRPPEEIIVIDDGSGDGTVELVQEKFPSVRYYRQKNRGVSHARNAGIKKAQHPWLAFLDSDDEWLPRKLEKQLNALCNGTGIKKNPELPIDIFICYTNEIWIRRGKRVNPMKKHAKYGGYIFQKCLPLCVISPSSVLIHRDIFGAVGLFDESLPACEDYDLWLRICARYPVLYLDEPLILKYGGHEDQLSQKFWGMDRFRIQALEKIIESGELNRADKKAAIKMLIKKTGVYMQGAEKRKKQDETEAYRKKHFYYRELLQTLPKMFIKL